MASPAKPEILSVIQNWRRPDNVRRVVEAVRQQTVPSFLALVDCAAGTEWQLPPDVTAKADVVFTVARQNLGPCCRFLPSCVLPRHEFTMFWLDDYLPGPRCLEAYGREWRKIEFAGLATLGQDGRSVDRDSRRIVRRRMTPRDLNTIQHVDVVTSAELCLTRNVPKALDHWHHGVQPKLWPQLSDFEDDLILCLGIRLATGNRSAVFRPADESESYRAVKLPSPGALSARPTHDERRNEFVSIMLGRCEMNEMRHEFDALDLAELDSTPCLILS